MIDDSPGPTANASSPGGRDAPRHRSGAVARMLSMPVATLRVWERRYALTRPATSPGGQRLYSADDVRRLALIRQLTDRGHAIGSLAPLDLPALQGVAATHALSAAKRAAPPGAPSGPWRVAVIGTALGARLQRPAPARRLRRAVVLLGPFDDVAQAAAALGRSEVDTLLVHVPQLHDGWLAALDAAAPVFAGVPKAVLYGFAADTVCEALASADTALLREPQPDAVLAQWLAGLRRVGTPLAADAPAPSTGAVPPRRWDDAALAEFAAAASTVACECPRHVAELLVQLARFETYSAECAHRSAADAALHGYLHRVAAASRVRFEAALEQVAVHEGLGLPTSTGDAAPGPADRRAGTPSTPKTRRRP